MEKIAPKFVQTLSFSHSQTRNASILLVVSRDLLQKKRTGIFRSSTKGTGQNYYTRTGPTLFGVGGLSKTPPISGTLPTELSKTPPISGTLPTELSKTPPISGTLPTELSKTPSISGTLPTEFYWLLNLSRHRNIQLARVSITRQTRKARFEPHCNFVLLDRGVAVQ